MTLEAWANPDPAGGDQWRIIVAKKAGGSVNCFLAATDPSGLPASGVMISGTYRNLVVGPPLSAGQRTLLATTYDGERLRIHVGAALLRQRCSYSWDIAAKGSKENGP